ncbi:MAG: sigma 54-dependent Fis family transcriptional regulator [Deltaproteobacteria bacterium]|nr:sigma 54-dependent Fis family transcriptional regulator [Deltaproteobacteria bacterium]
MRKSLDLAGEERLTRLLSPSIPGAEGVLVLRILNGEQKGCEAILLGGEPFVIGSSFEATLRLTDPSVSRRHLELKNLGGSVEAKDLGSTNGSYFEGTRFQELAFTPGAVFKVGETELMLVAPEGAQPVAPSEATAFGGLLGKSRKMRQTFAILERAAKTDATVLITGETGTGKEVVAKAIHDGSSRKDHPFVVVDCASIPGSLIESELFGHVKGAYTNAVSDRAGAFESANGGTIFLDEIGEMPAALQPRLLRVLETRTIKPVGANQFRPVDVRVVAATNRSLEDEVRERRFRSDLYFRLAVVRVALPPLRDRREDIPLLARHFLAELPSTHLELSADLVAELVSYDWPGNVRELRNVIHQAASLSKEGLGLAQKLRGGAPSSASADATESFRPFFELPYKEARKQVLEAFELAYAEHVVDANGGNVSKAAESAQVHRNVLHRILARKHGDAGPAEE